MSTKHEHSDDETDEKPSKSGKSRRELPAGAVTTLKAWLLSPEHFTHPYPTPQDQIMLMQKTGIDKKQLKNWFTNARRRIWKPMLKKQLEQGKLAATGAGGGGVAVPGVVPGLIVSPAGLPRQPPPPGIQTMAQPPDNPHSVQAMHAHYQQAVQQHGQQDQQQQQHPPPQQQPQQQPPSQPQQPQQQQGQPQQYDQYGNPVYIQAAPAPSAPTPAPPTYNNQQFYTPAPAPMATSTSIGSLPPISSSGTIHVAQSGHPSTLNKTDSHAVLMELFARDQDLVKQATEAAKIKAAAKVNDPSHAQLASHHPMKVGSHTRLMNVPALNSWPHFSSISSLNNLGSMTGVKSITSMSGADLASQGNLNKMGNLAQVKSMESMGRNDSYAFLEVFFGDKTLSQSNTVKEQRGVKREREEDNDVGLSLDADETPSAGPMKSAMGDSSFAPTPAPGAPVPAPLPAVGQDKHPETGTLKRAYDDALAARGLMSVSRSCEKLSDMALPDKMQKTLSREYLRQHQAQVQAVQSQQQQQQQQTQQQTLQTTTQYGPYTYTPAPAPVAPSSQQYAGQHPGQHPQQQQPQQEVQTINCQHYATSKSQAPLSDAGSNGEVKVPADAVCARCGMGGVDTQLKPCGHMFHERCLKPSLQTPVPPPKCPLDNTPIESVLVAVQAPENANPPQQAQTRGQQTLTWSTVKTSSIPAAESQPTSV